MHVRLKAICTGIGFGFGTETSHILHEFTKVYGQVFLYLFRPIDNFPCARCEAHDANAYT